MKDIEGTQLIKDRRILVVDDQPNIRKSLRLTLEMEGAVVQEAGTFKAGRDALAQHFAKTSDFDLLLLDVRLPDGNGLQLLQEMADKKLASRVIVISGEATIKDAFVATKLGAFDYIEKPFTPERIIVSASRCLHFNQLHSDNETMKKKLDQQQRGILGNAPKIKSLLELVKRVAASNSRVLIIGESGTGKELIAREIHRLSDRAERSMIKVNCAAIPSNLVESELFGHEKGAFTGALKTHRGVFERAHEGTLFLDEISELELAVQAKLLRVLQSGELNRVGGDKTLTTDVRLITATNKDLMAMVGQGTFREDLFYRLNVVSLLVPPLRERASDIPVLAQAFLAECCDAHSLGKKEFSPRALDMLASLPWRGNVRELKNVVEKISILSDETVIETLDGLPLDDQTSPGTPLSPVNAMGTWGGAAPGTPSSQGSTESGWRSPGAPADGNFSFVCDVLPWHDFHVQADAAFIKFVLQNAHGNVSEAARILKLERAYLHRLMKKLGIQKDVVVS